MRDLVRGRNELPQHGHAPTQTVWDLPTRLFHWSLVALIAVNVYTGNVGGLREMQLHMLSGFAVLALVLFRIVWGFIGSRHARFVDFVRGPRVIAQYLRDLLAGAHRPYAGHNPLGALSVLAMLASLLVQAATGLFARDDIITEGPLAKHVSKAMSNTLTEIHEANALVLYVLIAVHFAAVLAYLLIGKENLIRPMVTGRKALATVSPGRRDTYTSPWLALLVLALTGAAVWAVVTW